MKIEVTDLYDAFHELAAQLWRRFEFQGRGSGIPGQIGPRFDELVDQLETDLFFAACARRVWAQTEVKLNPAAVRALIRVCDQDRNPRPGASGQYHGHGFDWGTPRDASVENRVVAGDLEGTRRSDVRLVVILGAAA